MKHVEWIASGPQNLVLANAEGDMAIRIFSNRLRLVTSWLKVTHRMELLFPHDASRKLVTAQYFLSGDARITLGNGDTAYWSTDGASVIRTDTPGFVLQIEPGQVLRHVCVCADREDIEGILSGAENDPLGALLTEAETVDLAVELPVDPVTRKTAAELYHLKDATGLGAMKAEGLALALLSDLLGCYARTAEPQTDHSPVLEWQRQAAVAIRDVLDQDPRHVFAEGDLLNRFQIGESMARRVFQSVFGLSMAAYGRRAVLSRARDQLVSGMMSIKQISYEAGYTHVGNFTRAYRQEFGEAPSETRRGRAAG